MTEATSPYLNVPPREYIDALRDIGMARAQRKFEAYVRLVALPHAIRIRIIETANSP